MFQALCFLLCLLFCTSLDTINASSYAKENLPIPSDIIFPLTMFLDPEGNSTPLIPPNFYLRLPGKWSSHDIAKDGCLAIIPASTSGIESFSSIESHTETDISFLDGNNVTDNRCENVFPSYVPSNSTTVILNESVDKFHFVLCEYDSEVSDLENYSAFKIPSKIYAQLSALGNNLLIDPNGNVPNGNVPNEEIPTNVGNVPNEGNIPNEKSVPNEDSVSDSTYKESQESPIISPYPAPLVCYRKTPTTTGQLVGRVQFHESSVVLSTSWRDNKVYVRTFLNPGWSHTTKLRGRGLSNYSILSLKEVPLSCEGFFDTSTFKTKRPKNVSLQVIDPAQGGVTQGGDITEHKGSVVLETILYNKRQEVVTQT
eukprot:GHVR01160796.1.p1 GENE.GHVR01160796.1~~GHVR01160796.1.p1  ORF type:complete len:384 (-),score=46.09 GHVR01160796.1:15-1124(-)